MDLQLFDGKKIIVLRVLEIDHSGFFRFRPAVRTLDRHGDAITDEEIFFFVDLQERGGGKALFQNRLCLKQLVRGDPRVELFQGSTEIAYQQDLPVRFSAEGAVLSQHFRVIGKFHIPAKLIMKQVPGAFLYKDVLRIIVAHTSKLLLLDCLYDCQF